MPAREAARTARAGFAGISPGARRGPNRNLHHTVLSSDSAAALRYGCGAASQSGNAAAESGVSPSGRLARATRSRAGVSRAPLWRAARRPLAVGKLGLDRRALHRLLT